MFNKGHVLEIEDLKLHFGNVAAVNGVSMMVEEGELTGIIGPNGAGKTSLFNVITGVFPPTKGEIF